MRMIAVGILAVSALTAPLGAQRLVESRLGATATSSAHAELVRLGAVADTYNADVQSLKMTFTGLATGAAGAFAGGAIGYGMASCSDDEWFCGLGEMLVGAMIGEIVALPLGVHMNGEHSSLGSKIGTSVIIGAIALAAAPATQGVSILAMPVAQLITIISRENRAAARSVGVGSRS